MITVLHIFSKAELVCIKNTGSHFCGSGSTRFLLGLIRIQEDKTDPQKKEEIACSEELDVFFLGLRLLLQLGRPS
jgi:hypothetical protein